MTATLTEAEAYEKICWSADVADLDTLLGHLDRMPKLRRIKIDRLFIENNGFDVFDALKTHATLDVFYDAKYVEIPPKLAGLAESAVRHNVWMVNCMAGGLSNENFVLTSEELDGLKRYADACHEAGMRPCAVSVLTTKDDETVKREFNGRSREEQVLFYADDVMKAGFTDMVCSPKELRAIRAESTFDGLRLDTPGVRPAGSAKDDQVNADTPASTIAAGSNLLIIGRPITNGDPAENLENIVAELMAP